MPPALVRLRGRRPVRSATLFPIFRSHFWVSEPWGQPAAAPKMGDGGINSFLMVVEVLVMSLRKG